VQLSERLALLEFSRAGVQASLRLGECWLDDAPVVWVTIARWELAQGRILNGLLQRLKAPVETQEAFGFASVIVDVRINHICVARQHITVFIPARRP
jgi:hypothetical protein